IGILVAGLILLVALWYFGTRPRKGQGQGRRLPRGERDGDAARMEPTLGAQSERELAATDGAGEDVVQTEMGRLGASAGAASPNSERGRRVRGDSGKIVSLYVAARAGQVLRGPDVVVAAEKAGLTYGHMNVVHRLVESHPERGPIFSVANIRTPGSFEMASIQSLETPAIAFFLTLPAPVSALDAWDAMLPAAQRMAELLDGVLLDESRNALGRQRIAGLRDEL